MATLQLDVSDQLLAAFEAKYPPEERAEALTYALIDLVQDDPYSPEAFAEDERAIAEMEAGGGIPHEKVQPWLEALARGERLPIPQ